LQNLFKVAVSVGESWVEGDGFLERGFGFLPSAQFVQNNAEAKVRQTRMALPSTAPGHNCYI